jgi:hypothetical protein
MTLMAPSPRPTSSARTTAGSTTREKHRRHGVNIYPAVTARQELHSDGFDEVSVLLRWLAMKSDDKHVNADGSVSVGVLRSYEDGDPQPLTIKNGAVSWDIEST